MSSSSARIEVDAGGLAGAIAGSLEAECGPRARVSLEGQTVVIELGPEDLPHLRAALNSALRLVQAGHGALDASGAGR